LDVPSKQANLFMQIPFIGGDDDVVSHAGHVFSLAARQNYHLLYQPPPQIAAPGDAPSIKLD